MNKTDKALLRLTWETGRELRIDLDLEKTGDYTYRLIDSDGEPIQNYGQPVFAPEDQTMTAETVRLVLTGMKFVTELASFDRRGY